MRPFKYFKSCRGFTMIESVMFMSLAGIIMALTSQVLLCQLESYSTVSQQQTTVADLRYTLNRMSTEMLRIKTENIISVSETEFEFVDADGNSTSFKMSGDKIYRGENVMLENVDDMSFTYLDSADEETSDTEQVRQITVSITTEDTGAGSYTLSTQVIPRNFMYANYQ